MFGYLTQQKNSSPLIEKYLSIENDISNFKNNVNSQYLKEQQAISCMYFNFFLKKNIGKDKID